MILLTPNASRIAAAASTAYATEKHVSEYCCSVRLSSEFECLKYVTGESCGILVSGVMNDSTRGHCAYSIVVFEARLEKDAVLVAVGTALIVVHHLLESDLALMSVITLTWAVLGSLSPNDGRCCLVCSTGLGRTFAVVVRSYYRRDSLTRLACRLGGFFRPLYYVDCKNYDKLL